jgi:ribonuclease HII
MVNRREPSSKPPGRSIPPATTGFGVIHTRPRPRLTLRATRPHRGPVAKKAKPAQRLPLNEPELKPSFRRERRALNNGIWPVAGCDEAGRGPLAGPVAAAAVILDPERIPRGLNDSKKLDPEAREKLYEKICATAQVAVAFGSIERIDRDNILRASLWALTRAVKALPVRPKLVFVDGNNRIDCGCDCTAVVSGDALVSSIAAASIVAKVTRDRLMTRLGLAFPGYGFERHMGYSVPEHFEALARLGPSVHHRKSFAPVAEKLAALGGNASDEVIADLLPL